MATHSSILACKIPWREEPGVLQYIGSERVWYNWSNFIYIYIYIYTHTHTHTHTHIYIYAHVYIYTHIADSLSCIAETNATLQSNYSPIKINFKKFSNESVPKIKRFTINCLRWTFLLSAFPSMKYF